MNNQPTGKRVLPPLSFYLVAVAFPLLWGACSKSEPVNPSATTYEIGFHTDGVSTRAAYYDPLPTGATFGVLAYSCPTGVFDSVVNMPDLLYNACVEKYLSEGITTGYRYTPTAHWPSGISTRVMFAAYHPHNSSVAPGSIIVSPFTSPGLPLVTVVMGLEKGSIDFATATVGPIARIYQPSNTADSINRQSDYVNFRFNRRMSYVSFRCKAVNIPTNTRLYINRVTLRNIYRRATYNLSTNRWVDPGIDATTGATLNLTSVGTPVSESGYKDLVDPTDPRGTTLSVIPQQYDNVELSVLYTVEFLKPEGGCEHRIEGAKTVPLTVDWTASKQHIYDMEFSFNEVYGENFLMNFTVHPWKTVDVEIEM